MNDQEKNVSLETDNEDRKAEKKLDLKNVDLEKKDEHGETLKGKIRDWILFALICVIVVVFGKNKLFNRMGPISLLILFGGLFYFRHMEKQFADLI